MCVKRVNIVGRHGGKVVKLGRVLKSGRVELTEILFHIHRAIFVYLGITAPLIVVCSSDSQRLIKL